MRIVKKTIAILAFIIISPFILIAGMISGGLDFISFYYKDFVEDT